MTLSPASSIWYKHGLEEHESLKTVEILTRKVINLIRLWCQFKSMLRLKYGPFILSQGLFYLAAWTWIPKNEIWIILSSFATVECKFPKVPLVFSPFVKTTAAQPWQSWIYIFFLLQFWSTQPIENDLFVIQPVPYQPVQTLNFILTKYPWRVFIHS